MPEGNDSPILSAFDFIKKFGLDKTAAQMDQEEKELMLAENKILRMQLDTANKRIESLEVLCGMAAQTVRVAPGREN